MLGLGLGHGASAEDAAALSELELRIIRLEQVLEAQTTLLRREQQTALLKMQDRLQTLERDIASFVASTPTAPTTEGQSSGLNFAGNVVTRLADLEETVRALNGQFDEVRFSLNRLLQQVELMRQDNEYRFQNLETQTPSPPNSDTPQVLGQITRKAPVAQAGEVAPLVGIVGAGQLVGEGALEGTEGVEGIEASPLAPPAKAQNAPQIAPTPAMLYTRGLAALRAGSHSAAETDFKTIITDFASDALAANAQYWLGEVYYAQRRFQPAAQAFLSGYTQYGTSAKAPDSLLKLGMSLAALGESKNGCDAFAELLIKFPNAETAIRTRAETEKQRLQCGE